MKKRLKRDFYDRSTLEVAKGLLGKELVLHREGGFISCRIVETEAYIGAIDKAAHCYLNKMTHRTEVMFGPPGYSYVYLIYGMYHCFNIVTQGVGEGAAVLIRAVEPITGQEEITLNRYNKSLDALTKRELINLTNGPGKLCKAMGIDKSLNGADLCGDHFYLTEGEDKELEVVQTTRVNIDYAEEAIAFPWRYYIKDNHFVSRK